MDGNKIIALTLVCTLYEYLFGYHSNTQLTIFAKNIIHKNYIALS